MTIRNSLAEAIFLKDGGRQITVTASFSIANYHHDAGTQGELLHIADNSLYRSNAWGKTFHHTRLSEGQFQKRDAFVQSLR